MGKKSIAKSGGAFLFNVDELPKIMLRCMSREDAENFVKFGIVKFGTPRIWIDYCSKEGNNRIGDDLEGVFSRHSVIEMFSPRKSDFVSCQIKNGYFNYWRLSSLDLPVVCFYGIGKRNIKVSGVKTLYHTQDIGYVDVSYFKDFLNNSNFSLEEYNKVPKNEQKVIVFIKEPVKFVNLIKEKLGNKVLYDNVDYKNKKQSFDVNLDYPLELFIKDNDYEPQSEFRIVLTDSSIRQVELGDLPDFCHIEEMYFGRLDFAFQENNTFVYKLPREIINSWLDEGFEKLVTTFLAFVNLDYPVQQKTIVDYSELINMAKPYLEKYGITPYIDINENTNSFNVKYLFKEEKWKREFYIIYNDLHNYNDKFYHIVAVVNDNN